MTHKKPSKPNTPPPNIAELSTPAPQNIATSSTPTPPNIATSTLDLRSYRSHHEEGAPRSDRPSNEEAGNFELGNLKKETLRLQNELKQEKSKVAGMKRKIDNLEDHVRRIEEENSMLRDFNEIFSNESNELCEENKALQEELQQSKQLHIPRKIINPPQQYSPKRPNKRLKSREESPDEVAATDARAEMKNLLKGQIPKEYRLDYGKTFSEQTAKIYKKLIPELKKLMSGHYNLSVTQLSDWLRSMHKHKRDRQRKQQSGQLDKIDQRMHKKNRRVKAAIKLYERNDANIQEFDKDELLPMLLQNDCHSIEQSDSENESRQKLPNNKRFLHVYDREWRSNKLKHLLRNVLDPEAEYIQHAKKQRERIYDDDIEYDAADDVIDDLIQSYEDCEPMELNLTEPYSDFLLNSAEMNSIRPEDLDEIGESSTTQQRAERSQKGKEKATKEAKEDEEIYEIFEADKYN
ncbi:uncharacterized protein OCT59_012450 [Rhizophagus irregularis]|uniref:uncharacterized protein n=1 Tax=Rhizophagus irregularis TaxID=588596 RepID=UPI0033290961|nr:hypothetical protein OCT59_012450 [Rhizophagus irregularis]